LILKVPLGLDNDVPTELLLVFEDWVECGMLRKNPAAPAPIMTIAIMINVSRDAGFVLPRGLAAEVKLCVAVARLRTV